MDYRSFIIPAIYKFSIISLKYDIVGNQLFNLSLNYAFKFFNVEWFTHLTHSISLFALGSIFTAVGISLKNEFLGIPIIELPNVINKLPVVKKDKWTETDNLKLSSALAKQKSADAISVTLLPKGNSEGNKPTLIVPVVPKGPTGKQAIIISNGKKSKPADIISTSTGTEDVIDVSNLVSMNKKGKKAYSQSELANMADMMSAMHIMTRRGMSCDLVADGM